MISCVVLYGVCLCVFACMCDCGVCVLMMCLCVVCERLCEIAWLVVV